MLQLMWYHNLSVHETLVVSLFLPPINREPGYEEARTEYTEAEPDDFA